MMQTARVVAPACGHGKGVIRQHGSIARDTEGMERPLDPNPARSSLFKGTHVAFLDAQQVGVLEKEKVG